MNHYHFTQFPLIRLKTLPGQRFGVLTSGVQVLLVEQM